MRTIIIFTLLLANLPAYSVPVDSADADYCLDLNNKYPAIIFVKKNNDPKPILLNIQEPLMCKYYSSDTSADFKFDTGEACNRFRIQAKLTGGEYPESPKMVKLPQIIQIDFPKWEKFFFSEERNKKEDWLLFKNQIIDAYIYVTIRCQPNLDTTFAIPFRAYITGECEVGIKEEWELDLWWSNQMDLLTEEYLQRKNKLVGNKEKVKEELELLSSWLINQRDLLAEEYEQRKNKLK